MSIEQKATSHNPPFDHLADAEVLYQVATEVLANGWWNTTVFGQTH
jgi:hypothetical protein